MDPRSSPPICELTVSMYVVPSLVGSLPLARFGTDTLDGPCTCSRSVSILSVHGSPLPMTLYTVKGTCLGLRAAHSMTTLPSASGSSPMPLSVNTYLSPVDWLVRMHSPVASVIQSGVKSSG